MWVGRAAFLNVKVSVERASSWDGKVRADRLNSSSEKRLTFPFRPTACLPNGRLLPRQSLQLSTQQLIPQTHKPRNKKQTRLRNGSAKRKSRVMSFSNMKRSWQLDCLLLSLLLLLLKKIFIDK